MFMPLCRRRWRGVATIEFPDLGVSDYNAPLIAPYLDLDAATSKSLWSQICRALPAADIFRLDKSPASLANPFARLDWVQELKLRAWPLPLPATFATYETEFLSRKARKEHRRKRNNLTERVGEWRLVTAEDRAQGERIYAALRRERLARFGSDNLLEDPCFALFYRSVMFDNWGALGSLSALQCGDRILAAQLSLRWRGSRLLIMHAFEPELESLSAGIVAIDALIAQGIAAGESCLDFTVGNEGYKREFGVTEARLLGGIYPLSAFGRLFALAYRPLVEGKEAVKRRLELWRNVAPAAVAADAKADSR
jgi:CelD/BcsL family acetyltransferase involved in cellulose biosynthesis